MPIYEFSCSECHQNFERLLRSYDWKGTRCPQCGSTKIVKSLSVFASQNGETSSGDLSSCSGTPSSCGRCGTGAPHSH